MRKAQPIWSSLYGFVPTTSVLRRDRRGSVGLWVALMAPVLSAALGLGIEMSGRSTVQIETQRNADAAAIAGTLYYNANTGAANLTQNAAMYAAHVAELNGASGTSSPTWTATTKTQTDNTITMQITSGIANLSSGCSQSDTMTFANASPNTTL